MDEQSTQADSELEIDTEGHDAADTTASDTKEQETDSKGEQEQEALNLEEQKAEAPKETRSKAEIVRDQQIEAWTVKIASGEKTLEDLPANLQWLKPHVEAKLGVKSPDVKAPDIRGIIASTLAEEREEAEFKRIEATLQRLDRDKKAQIIEKYKSFRAKKLSKLDALNVTLEALNIDPEQDKIDAKRQAMRLRTPGRYKAPKGADPAEIHEEAGYAEVVRTMPEAQRLEYLRKLRRGR